MDKVRTKYLIVRIVALWFMIGLLLSPVVWHTMRNWSWVQPSTRDYFFVAIFLALIVGLAFVGKVKGIFDRIPHGLFLIFQAFPTLAFILKPALYIMYIPTGIFILLCAPWNPLFILPQTRWLLAVVPLPEQLAIILMIFTLFYILPIGLGMFTVAFIQLIREKGLVMSGLYKVVRHPQYLGLILTTLGLTFLGLPGIRPMSLIAWIILVFAYIWLAHREEASLQKKYGEEFLSYKKRVPFLLPLLPRKSKFLSNSPRYLFRRMRWRWSL